MRFIRKSVSLVLVICYMIMLVSGLTLFKAQPAEAATTYTYQKDSLSGQVTILRHRGSGDTFDEMIFYYKSITSDGISTWEGSSGLKGDVITINMCKDPGVGTTASGATVAISKSSLAKSYIPADCSGSGGNGEKVVSVAVSAQYTNLEFSTGTGGRITVQPLTIQLIIDGTTNVLAEGKTEKTVGDRTTFDLGTVVLQNGFFVPGKYKLCVKELPKVACKTFTKSEAAASIQYVIGLDYKDKAVQAISTNTAKEAQNTTDIEDSCYANTSGLGWVVCPLLSLLVGAVNKAKDVVTSLLTTKPLVFGAGQDKDAVYQTWQNFRNVADGLLIIVFLLIIFGTTASIGIDNYTIKKALPRLIAAAILIQFSYLICSLAIDLSNVIGGGIASLISGSTDVRAGFGAWDSFFIAAAGIAALAGLIVSIGSLTILFVILGMFFSIIGALLTLVFRQILILVLVVLAPVAFVAWVLPNTEGLFKMWNKNFVRVLAMFPLVGVIFGASMLFAKVSVSQNGTWQDLIGIIAIVLPLFAIPYTFKLGGQAMSFGSGLINGKIGGLGKSISGSEGAKNFRKHAKDSAYIRAQNGSNAVARMFGRAGAVGVGAFTPRGGFTENSRARNAAKIAGGAGRALNEQADHYKTYYEAVNDKAVLLAAAQDLSAPGKASAAINRLQVMGGNIELSDLRDAFAKVMVEGSKQQQSAATSVWNSLDRDKLNDANPDIAKLGIGRPGEDMRKGSADFRKAVHDFAGSMSAKTITTASPQMWDRLAHDPDYRDASGTAAIEKVQLNTVENAVKGIDGGKMNGEQLGAILDYVHGADTFIDDTGAKKQRDAIIGGRKTTIDGTIGSIF